MFRTTHSLVAKKAGGRSSARRLVATVGLILVSILMPATAVSQSHPPVTVGEHDGVYRVVARFSIAEAPSFAHAALTDYAGIPRFMPDVRTSSVLERGDGRAVVEQEAVAHFMMFSKRIHLVLEVQEEARTIRFRDRCGRSFARYEGVWTIAERDGHTHVTYELWAKPSFDVPSFVLKRLLKRDATEVVGRLKAEIAARARPPAQ